jgi:hypothetical protein
MEQIKKNDIEQIKPTFPSEVIDLPSKGKLYDIENPLSSGKIELKYPTAREEDILTSKNLIQRGIVIDTFIKALIVNKQINTDSLLLGDKNAILIASRILAYGKDYPVEITCPKCSEKVEFVIDLAEINTKELDYLDGRSVGFNEFECTLPASKAKVVFKVLTQGDENSIESELKSMKKLSGSKVDSEITTRMRYAIISTNGDDDRKTVKSFIENVLSVDSLAFRKEMSKISPDIDMKFEFECSSCGHSERMGIPLGVNFFWPSGTV